MIDQALLGALAERLDVPRRVLEGDIGELIHCWREALGKAPAQDIDSLHRVLSSLLRAYLRGHGYRMGSMQGYERHQALFAQAVTAVVMRAMEVGFEALGAAGITDPLEYTKRLRASFAPGVLDEADEVLRRKQ